MSEGARILLTASEDETIAAARDLVATMDAGTVLLLRGDLGAGKTAFVRGLALGLGLDEDAVSSPTFTLMHEYRGGRLPLFHVDLYRLPNGAAIDDLGFDDALDEGVLAIEWPERLRLAPTGAIGIHIDIKGPDVRLIRVTPPGASPVGG
ncbi:MAG TPA: tRNA (adenosine(37)-N6)-threonylcarbamoyltransferase complex ATPase subunit type 1 TsaE [Luteitalea sp.]|nr:tRNA (adenosine(37)-N6)-threonylcarbamoyltransferase complex ATPase subunit type 1 TsaE [Luteitalea sp.]